MEHQNWGVQGDRRWKEVHYKGITSTSSAHITWQDYKTAAASPTPKAIIIPISSTAFLSPALGLVVVAAEVVVVPAAIPEDIAPVETTMLVVTTFDEYDVGTNVGVGMTSLVLALEDTLA